MIKPNFKNSILNVSASLNEYLGNETSIPKIKILSEKLKQDYKNVVYICIDGMGMYPLKENLDKNSILVKNVKKVITSVFPSTTTNATSSLLSCSYPMEHGMFGWSLYFDEIDKVVDLFTAKESLTKNDLEDKDFVKKTLPFNYFFNSIKRDDIETNCVMVGHTREVKKNLYSYDTYADMFKKLNNICKKEGKQFVYAYMLDPDATMHKFGVHGKETKKVFEEINKRIEKFALKNKDTLIVITSDHGHIDIKDYIEIYKDKALLDTLLVPMYLEPRAVAFKVKKGKENIFKKEIKKYKQIKLFKVSDLIAKNYFGTKTDKAKYLGDYIGVVKDDFTQIVMYPSSRVFKGHHTGLSKKEMLLPLIIIN